MEEITIEYFEKLINHEIEWLRYYAYSESKKSLTINSDIYDHLVSIGYTKRVIPLWDRCHGAILTSDEKISEKTCLSDLKSVCLPRNILQNQLTALEVYWIMFPDKRQEIIDKLI